MDFAHGESVLGTRVNDREIELLVVRLQFDEEIEDHVEHLVRPGVFAVDFIDHNDRLDLVLERFLEHETSLGLRAVVRVDDEENAVDHFHDALHFAAKIGMAGRVGRFFFSGNSSSVRGRPPHLPGPGPRLKPGATSAQPRFGGFAP